MVGFARWTRHVNVGKIEIAPIETGQGIGHLLIPLVPEEIFPDVRKPNRFNLGCEVSDRLEQHEKRDHATLDQHRNHERIESRVLQGLLG